MHFFSYIHSTKISLLMIVTALFATTILRAEADSSSIQIHAGQMLEVGTDAASLHPDFSWVFTKDRRFQSAQRTRFFQTRPTTTGTYTLDVSIQDTSANRNEYRAFTVTVTDPVTPSSLPRNASGSLKAILTTNPPLRQGTAALPPSGGMLMIDASASLGTITSYSLDINASVDSDNNGNSTDDKDNVDTFSEKSGSPLYYFILPTSEPRTIWLTITNAATGQTDRTSINVTTQQSSFSQSNQQINDPNNPIAIDGSNMTIFLSARLPSAQTADKQLLYQWDFGDQRKSLLTSPSHTYALPGIYSIKLTVIDIATGNHIFTGTNNVQIQPPIGTTSSASNGSLSSSASTSSAEATGAASTFSFTTLIKPVLIVVALLTLAIALYALYAWIKKRTIGSLERTLERMEKTIVKPDAKTAVLDAISEPVTLKREKAPAPVERKAENVGEQEKSKTEFRKDRENVVPVTSTGPVPSWLAKASEKSATPPSPPKPPVVPPPAPKLPEKPVQKPTPMPPSLPATPPAAKQTQAPTTTQKPVPPPAVFPKAAPVAPAPKPPEATKPTAPVATPSPAPSTPAAAGTTQAHVPTPPTNVTPKSIPDVAIKPEKEVLPKIPAVEVKPQPPLAEKKIESAKKDEAVPSLPQEQKIAAVSSPEAKPAIATPPATSTTPPLGIAFEKTEEKKQENIVPATPPPPLPSVVTKKEEEKTIDLPTPAASAVPSQKDLPKNSEDEDTPIAFIQADSITQGDKNSV